MNVIIMERMVISKMVANFVGNASTMASLGVSGVFSYLDCTVARYRANFHGSTARNISSLIAQWFRKASAM
jgi:hypothetical protein